MRLYFKVHLTDLVRAFRYDAVPVEEAKTRLKSLSERYGEDVIADAAEELLEIEYNGTQQVARLRDNVRHLARGILGSPPKSVSSFSAEVTSPPRADPVVPSSDKQNGRRPVNDAAGSLAIRLGKELLLQRIVQTFGDDVLTLDAARDRLRPLLDQFGNRAMDIALEELIDIDDVKVPHTSQLKPDVRRLAIPILGSQPAKTAERPADSPAEMLESLPENIDGEGDLRDDEPLDEEELPRAGNTASNTVTAPEWLVPHDADEARGKIVRLSRSEILMAFADWIKDTGQVGHMLSQEQLQSFSPQTRTVPDYILTSDDESKLVTVRPKMSMAQRHDLEEWQKVFGTDYAVVRVWPVKNYLGWVWTEATIFKAVDAQEISRQPQSSAPANAGAATKMPTTESARPTSKMNDHRGGDPSSPVSPPIPPSPGPGNSVDLSHVSHRLDNIQEDLDDAKLAQIGTSKKIERMQAEIDAAREQLTRATEDE